MSEASYTEIFLIATPSIAVTYFLFYLLTRKSRRRKENIDKCNGYIDSWMI